MSSLNALEIDINFQKSRYIATCNTFPTCKGTGKTAEEAVKKLSVSISNQISKMAKESFSKLLDSSRYTTVVLDTSNPSKSQSRVYGLDNALMQMTKSLVVKLKSIEAMPQLSKKEIRQLIQNSEGSVKGSPISFEVSAGNTKTAFPNSDGLMFGFPMSFN